MTVPLSQADIEHANRIWLDGLKPGDTVLDIGANKGTFARLYAKVVGPTGHVRAIEPHPATATVARTICRDIPQIVVQHIALSDVDGRMPLFADTEDPRRSSLWVANVPEASRGESYSVSVTTLDVLVGTLPRFPSLIKVDAQGAEAKILRGGTATLDAMPTWQIEVWPNGLLAAGDTADDVLQPFIVRGYVPAVQVGEQLVIGSWTPVHEAVARCVRPHSSVDVLMFPPTPT